MVEGRGVAFARGEGVGLGGSRVPWCALADAMFQSDAPVTVVWRKRVWRCTEQRSSVTAWTETHELATSWAVLTSRAVRWAVGALAHDDTTVSALARHLRVDGHSLWVDEYIWRSLKRGPGPGGHGDGRPHPR